MLYNQVQDLQSNGKITIHPNLCNLLKAEGIKSHFNFKHQDKLLTRENTLTASLQRSKTTPPTSVLDMTLNNPAILELWGIWSTPSLPSLAGPLWP